MREQIAGNWWVLALRGGLAVLLGIFAFASPGATLAFLVTLFGVYALFDGVIALITAARWHHPDARWWFLILEGVIGVGFGILAFAHPLQTAVALIQFVAFWAIAPGIFGLIGAVQLHRTAGEWLLGVTGLVSLLLGIGLLLAPGAGLTVIAWMLGAYALLFGAGLLSLAFRLRRQGPGAAL